MIEKLSIKSCKILQLYLVTQYVKFTVSVFTCSSKTNIVHMAQNDPVNTEDSDSVHAEDLSLLGGSVEKSSNCSLQGETLEHLA